VYIFVQAATDTPTWTGNGASIAQIKIRLIITMEKYKAILTKAVDPGSSNYARATLMDKYG
jgi:hypothetical protein